MIELLRASPLFRKIMLSFVLASVFFLSLLTLIIVYSNEKLENDLLARQIEFELNNVREMLDRDPQAILPGSAGLSTYLGSRQPQRPVPQHLIGLSPGVHHDLRLEGKSYHVVVEPHNGDRIYIQYDISDIENSEALLNLILLVAWVVLLAIVILIAMILSRELSRPIRQLSEHLVRLNPNKRGVRISQHFADDEVGRIARAFDDYSERVDGYVEKQTAFAAMASHELRSPLTVVQTSADLIGRHSDGARIGPYLEKIQRATSNMGNLIHALLAVTRDKPNRDVEESIKLQPLVAEIVNNISAETHARQVRIDITLDEQDSVIADPTLLTVVLSNLIHNAVKHGEQSSIVIAMQANFLTISDSGMGIDIDALEQIFDFGYRGENSQGYGVGLYISKLVCDHQGWHLGLERNAAGGTTATIDFTV